MTRVLPFSLPRISTSLGEERMVSCRIGYKMDPSFDLLFSSPSSPKLVSEGQRGTPSNSITDNPVAQNYITWMTMDIIESG